MHNIAAGVRSLSESNLDTNLVQSYLDSLLRDVSADPDPDSIIELSVSEPLTVVSMPEIEITVADEEARDPVIFTELLVTGPQIDPDTERVIPEWAKQGFAGLVFKVAGLKMAAPLHALGGISLIADKLQPVVGQADWFMGLLRWNGRNLRVIDTARFVMPERLVTDSHRLAYQSVIVLGDSQWALAVDCADESVNLKADEIRWKQHTGSRPWLAGTLLQRLCALLDVDNLMMLLQQHEQRVRDSCGPDAQGQ